MKNVRIAVLVCAFAAAGAQAQGKSCGPDASKAAEDALYKVVSWDSMYKAWQEHRHCDVGLTEDVFNDALMRLAVNWQNVDRFAQRYQGDPDFKQFVKKHLAALGSKEDAKAVYSRAKSNCPPKLEAFCADLAEAAKAAQ